MPAAADPTNTWRIASKDYTFAPTGGSTTPVFRDSFKFTPPAIRQDK